MSRERKSFISFSFCPDYVLLKQVYLTIQSGTTSQILESWYHSPAYDNEQEFPYFHPPLVLTVSCVTAEPAMQPVIFSSICDLLFTAHPMGF